MDLYAENILEHYKHPRNAGMPANASAVHEEVNHSCGDAVTVGIVMDEGRIRQIGWTGHGCAVSQAGMSILSEDVVGKAMEEVDVMTKEDVLEMLGVPVGPRRFKCALLGLHTLKNAVRKARGEEAQSWAETVTDA